VLFTVFITVRKRTQHMRIFPVNKTVLLHPGQNLVQIQLAVFLGIHHCIHIEHLAGLPEQLFSRRQHIKGSRNWRIYFGYYLYISHFCVFRADFQPFCQSLELRLGTAGKDLNPAIAEITHPPGEPQRSRLAPGAVAKEHALDTTGHKKSPAHHGSLMVAACPAL
jgi:hypothetical protein